MGQPRRPVIGITCYVESIDRPPWVSQPSAVLPRMYLEHVARAGGIPVILPPGDEHLTDAEADAMVIFWDDLSDHTFLISEMKKTGKDVLFAKPNVEYVF